MRYKIGEVSRILGLSSQMIRYYEKCGVINSERVGDGSYRNFSDLDILLLFQAIKYKEWGINIKEIDELVSKDYFNTLYHELDVFERELSEKIKSESLLLKRVEEIRKQIVSCKYNIGSYWFDYSPAYYLYRMGKSVNDDYDFTILDPEMSEQIYDGCNICYFDPFVEYDGDTGYWWFAIEKKYHDALQIIDAGDYKVVEEQLCLQSCIDMGEIGCFRKSQLLPFTTYAREKGYEPEDSLKGLLTGVGSEKNQFSRILKIQLPIKTL